MGDGVEVGKSHLEVISTPQKLHGKRVVCFGQIRIKVKCSLQALCRRLAIPEELQCRPKVLAALRRKI